MTAPQAPRLTGMLRAFVPSQLPRSNIDAQSIQRAAAVQAHLLVKAQSTPTQASPAERIFGGEPTTRPQKDAYSAFVAAVVAAVGADVLNPEEVSSYVTSIWDTLSSSRAAPQPYPGSHPYNDCRIMNASGWALDGRVGQIVASAFSVGLPS